MSDGGNVPFVRAQLARRADRSRLNKTSPHAGLGREAAVPAEAEPFSLRESIPGFLCRARGVAMNSLPEWYLEKRGGLEAIFAGPAIPPRDAKGLSSTSPTGRYVLEVTAIGTGPQTWDFGRGCVLRAADRRIVADIKRNYGEFPFAWVSQEGKEYLVCGEDYQGHTVVDLEAALAYVFVHEGAERGSGFCWRTIRPSPNGKRLLVEGCYWASDFEWRVYDFTHPVTGPFPVIAFLSWLHGDPYEDAWTGPGDAKWLDDNRVELDSKDRVDLRESGSSLSRVALTKRYPHWEHLFRKE